MVKPSHFARTSAFPIATREYVAQAGSAAFHGFIVPSGHPIQSCPQKMFLLAVLGRFRVLVSPPVLRAHLHVPAHVPLPLHGLSTAPLRFFLPSYVFLRLYVFCVTRPLSWSVKKTRIRESKRCRSTKTSHFARTSDFPIDMREYVAQASSAAFRGSMVPSGRPIRN